MSRRLRPAPDDFVERAKTMTHKELVAHYGSSSGTVSRWRLETGAPTHTRGYRPRPIPADFSQKAAVMTWEQLRNHYQVSNDALTRWRAVARSLRTRRAARCALHLIASARSRRRCCASNWLGTTGCRSA